VEPVGWLCMCLPPAAGWLRNELSAGRCHWPGCGSKEARTVRLESEASLVVKEVFVGVGALSYRATDPAIGDGPGLVDY